MILTIIVIPIIFLSGYIVSIIRGNLSFAERINRTWLLLGIAVSVVRVFLYFFGRYYISPGILSPNLLRVILEFSIIFGLPYLLLGIGVKGLEKRIEEKNQNRIKEIADAYKAQNKIQG